MRSIVPFIVILAGAALMVPWSARAQSSLSKTTLGQDQNDDRDYVNSLTAAPSKSYGKGEKKSQMSKAELKSKSINDSTFGGSLLNMGIDSGAPRLDESKLVNAKAEESQKPAASNRQAATATEKKSAAAAKEPAAAEKPAEEATQPAESEAIFSNLSTTATLGDSLSQADAAAAEAKSLSSSGDTHNKDQANTTGGKTSNATSSDKSSDTKPNGDH